MPCYKIPLLLRVEPLLLDIEVEDEISQLPRKASNFKHNPWKKSAVNREFVWHRNEIQTIKVYVEYPLSVDLTFDKVCAITAGVKAICYNSPVTIKGKQATVEKNEVVMFEVKVKPLETGKLYIRGVSIGWMNIICDHYVNPNGVGIYAVDYEKKYSQNICEIPVVEGFPRLSTRVEAIQLMNGTLLGLRDEQCPINIHIKNISGPDLKIARLELVVCMYKKKKRFLLQKIDLVEKFEEIRNGEWYKVQQVVPMTDKIDFYVFELHFASNNDLVLVDKYNILLDVFDAYIKKK